MYKMRDSGVEWLGEIPEHWEIKKLKCQVEKLERGTSPDYTDEQITKVVNQATFSKGFFDKSNIRFSTKDSSVSQGLLKKGDVLLASTGGGILGKTYFFEENDTYVADGHVTIVRTISTLFSKYLYYYFLINYDTFNALMSKGSTNQIELQRDSLGKMPIPLPPSEEQEKISAYLDKKCGQIDKIIELKNQQINLLAEYKKTLISETVTKGLDKNVKLKDSGVEWVGDIPEHWQVKKAKYIFKQRSTKGNNIELQLLSPTQKFGVIPQELYEQLTKNNAVKVSEETDLTTFKTIHKGDYCISLRSFQGGFEYSFYEGVVSPAYTVFYSDLNINDIYFKYLFKEPSFINKINSLTSSFRDGKNISFSDFRDTFIPLPPTEEQAEISAYLDDKCKTIDKITDLKKQQINLLQEYRKSLIYEVVTGKKEIFQEG